jgi:hypothetical protein
MTTTPLKHVGQNSFGQGNLSHHIHLHQLAVYRHICIHTQGPLGETGIVDQQVNSTELVEHCLYCTRQSLPICNVQRQNQHLIRAEALIAATLGYTLQFTLPAGGKNKAGTLLSKTGGQGFANTCGCAGYPDSSISHYQLLQKGELKAKSNIY